MTKSDLHTDDQRPDERGAGMMQMLDQALESLKRAIADSISLQDDFDQQVAGGMDVRAPHGPVPRESDGQCRDDAPGANASGVEFLRGDIEPGPDPALTDVNNKLHQACLSSLAALRGSATELARANLRANARFPQSKLARPAAERSGSAA